jgi:membrane protease YdiL (CAAX protease family)
MKKSKLYLLGVITLIAFPIPAFAFLHWQEKISLFDFLELKSVSIFTVLTGILVGGCYALLAMAVMKLPIFEKVPLKIDALVRSLHLNTFDAIFLSLCAGIGEELLFRSGVQQFLGIWTTSILFVAIHGYFSIKQPMMNLYGLLVLPFILILGYSFEIYGLWFVASAHFSYDLLLFLVLIHTKQPDLKVAQDEFITYPHDQATSSEEDTSEDL